MPAVTEVVVEDGVRRLRAPPLSADVPEAALADVGVGAELTVALSTAQPRDVPAVASVLQGRVYAVRSDGVYVSAGGLLCKAAPIDDVSRGDSVFVIVYAA